MLNTELSFGSSITIALAFSRLTLTVTLAGKFMVPVALEKVK